MTLFFAQNSTSSDVPDFEITVVNPVDRNDTHSNPRRPQPLPGQTELLVVSVTWDEQ